MDTDDCTDNRTTPGHIDAALAELLHDLGPYLEDILPRSAFYRFFDLPAELRCKIYEQYFLDDQQALTTQDWTELGWWRVQAEKTLKRRAPASFLPNLCLANKALLHEVAPFLLASLYVSFSGVEDMMAFVAATKRFSTSGQNIAHNIRNMTVLNANSMRLENFTYSPVCISRSQESCRRYAALSNRSVSTALNAFQGLFELYISFYTPVKFESDLLSPPGPPDMTALALDGYLDGFDVRTVLGLSNLRRITLVGISGLQNLESRSISREFTRMRRDTRSNLKPLMRLAGEIKARFKAQSQDVEVRTFLSWGEDKNECKVLQ
jgi:hypothetical protein